MLLPSKLVKSLKHINPTTNNNPVLKLARNITKSWKWWATVSPFRAFRFNVRNFSGDNFPDFLFWIAVIGFVALLALYALREGL